MCRGQGPVPSHKTGSTNPRHDIPSETNHDMTHVINWFFCAVQNERLVIQVTPGDVFQCLPKVKRRAMRTRSLTLDIFFVLPHKCITFTAAWVHNHFRYFFITIKRKLNGCGVLSNFRIDWKRRLLEVCKMTELDARVEIEAIQRPWRAIINTRGRITTGLTLHVICNLHRPAGDSLSDTYDLSPVWSTSSVRRAAPVRQEFQSKILFFPFRTSAHWSHHYKEKWTPCVRVLRERQKRDVLRGQGGRGWVYSWESSWAVGPRGGVGCRTRSITHRGRGLCHLCN